MIEIDDINQEIVLRQLVGKKQTRKQVIADMLKSRAYNRSFRGRVKHVSINFMTIAIHTQDIDSVIDYKNALLLINGRKRDILRLWAEGYRIKEISNIYNYNNGYIGQIIKQSIEEIKEIWHLKT